MYVNLISTLALLGTALALPATAAVTSNLTTSNLTKRDHYGWVGSFRDSKCQDPHTNDRLELSDEDCHWFEYKTDYIGINFGTGVHGFSKVKVYVDSLCQTPGENPVMVKQDGKGETVSLCWHPGDEYRNGIGIKIIDD